MYLLKEKARKTQGRKMRRSVHGTEQNELTWRFHWKQEIEGDEIPLLIWSDTKPGNDHTSFYGPENQSSTLASRNCLSPLVEIVVTHPEVR